MSVDAVRAYLEPYGWADRVSTFDASTATVADAAAALGVRPAQIAKTISLRGPEDSTILIVAAGDAKIASGPFKRRFGLKASMLKFDEVEQRTGHAVGGVCPFAVAPGVAVFLDESLRRFAEVFPAAGSPHAAVRLRLDELAACIPDAQWVDVCSGWREAPEPLA
ncbi:MAG TPA: YbaK/EbsC family protein [Pseudoclavibacter sp.]|nr:YbaK/EbsC family protein [Pseudoclavibacter sp.]